MVRSKSMYNDCNPNPNLEGVQCDFSKRYGIVTLLPLLLVPCSQPILFMFMLQAHDGLRDQLT